jgi:hypothetical protein
LLEHRALGWLIELLAGQADVDPQCHEALLGTVMEVALEEPALGLSGLDDASG